MPRNPALSTEDAFLRTILENPDHDAPRLVFADWLEERGHARGTFIRAQIRRTELSPRDPEWKELLAQESLLLKQYEPEWSAPILRQVDRVEYRRGFVEHVEVSAAKFLKNADRLFRLAPVRSLRLTQVNSSLARWIDCPHLGKLNALDLSCNGQAMGSKPLRDLVQSPHVIPWTKLNLNQCQLGPAGPEVLASAPNLARLHTLELSHNSIGESGVRQLAASPYLTQLREVHLAGNQIENAGAVALAGAAKFRLVRLDLSRNRIGNEGAAALANCPALAELRRLELRENAISNRGIEAIASSPHLGRLEHLDLSLNRINDRGVQALAGSTALPHLAYLDVKANEFSPTAALALANSPHFPRMRDLLLGVRPAPVKG